MSEPDTAQMPDVGIEPLGDQFIVMADPDITHRGRFELPEAKQSRMGTVLKCGPEVKSPLVQPGVRVQWLFDPATRFDIDADRNIDPDKCRFIRLQELDIIGVLTENGHGQTAD